ncbi:hypothetical protein GCM10022200_05440 [Microbacterium awajiense]|uniref:Uncharacterized protein n=2 Tax=Microbacterium awajiense TaxID=415214 RepID=A0ABP7A6Q5_9MICO
MRDAETPHYPPEDHEAFLRRQSAPPHDAEAIEAARADWPEAHRAIAIMQGW